MKKQLAILSLIIAMGGFVYLGGTSNPAFAGNTADEQGYTTANDHFRQDTVPGTDTSKHKMKMKKNKAKGDSTWRKDTIPQ